MKRVFISYRRSDSQDVTGRIYDAVSRKFGRKKIFKDVDSVPPGVDFRDYISDTIENTAVMLVIVGKDWLEAFDSKGSRRLDDPEDYVRLEIEAALKKDIPIIPVLLGNAKMPAVENLPDSLKKLTYRNALPIRPDPDFNKDVSRVIHAVGKLLINKKRIRFAFILIATVMIITTGILFLKKYKGMTETTPNSEESVSSNESLRNSESITSLNLDEYYQGIDDLSSASLKLSLARLTRRDHRSISYTEAKEHTVKIHEDLFDTSKIRIYYDDNLVAKTGYPSLWNREHIWPKSYGFENNDVVLADLFNIVPSDPRQNSQRVNKAFTDVPQNGMFLIEPSIHGDIRGDLARILFYMAIRYEGVGGEPDLELTDNPLQVQKPFFGPLSILLKWHNEDGVSLMEKERNNRIYKIQGNRNPFVDHPEFAELIWE